jgi:hypothetical protein
LVIVGDGVVTGGNVPVVETDDDGPGAAAVGAGLTVDSGNDETAGAPIGAVLSPPLPISTEPNGIPARETPPGDEDDVAADDDASLLEGVPHVSEVAALPGNGVPVPTPNPPPSKFVLELESPADALPMAEHVVSVPAIPIVPASAGLSPGDASSVAPRGKPIGATDEPGVTPSGEVVPIPGVGLPVPPTCAKTGLQPKSAAAMAAINARRIVISFVPTPAIGWARQRRASRPAGRLQDGIERRMWEMHPFHANMPVLNYATLNIHLLGALDEAVQHCRSHCSVLARSRQFCYQIAAERCIGPRSSRSWS